MTPEILRLIRLSRKMTVREFAEQVGCHFSLINQIENGKRKLTKRTEEKIRQAFDLDADNISEVARLVRNIKK